MNKKVLCTLSFLALLPLTSFAEGDDLGVDLGVGAEKKITNGVDFNVDFGVRTQNDSKDIERYSAGLGFDFKVLSSKKFDLKLSTGWEYIWQNKLAEKEMKFDSAGDEKGYNETKQYWQNRNRLSIGIGASYKPNKRWNFSLKETMQYNHYNAVDSISFKYRLNDDDEYYMKSASGKDVRDRFVLRSKAGVQYDIRKSPFAPFASVDYGCGLNYTANKWKISAGTDIKINKKNKLTVYYRFQTEDDDDEANGHIIGVGYNFKF